MINKYNLKFFQLKILMYWYCKEFDWIKKFWYLLLKRIAFRIANYAKKLLGTSVIASRCLYCVWSPLGILIVGGITSRGVCCGLNHNYCKVKAITAEQLSLGKIWPWSNFSVYVGPKWYWKSMCLRLFKVFKPRN